MPVRRNANPTFDSETPRGNRDSPPLSLERGNERSAARPIPWLATRGPPPRMTKTLRLLLVTAAVATVALGGAGRAICCGNSGAYSYVGVGAPMRAYGVPALISPLDAFDVVNGHVAGWVGVGGPGEGPNGTNEWIQVGYAGFPSITGSDIYYEVAQPGRYPTYHQVSAGLPVGIWTKMTVLEIH